MVGPRQRADRAVITPAGSAALLRSVEQLAEQMHHSPDSTTLTGDALTIRLATGGDVTGLDVELAARIDQVLSGSHATGTTPASGDQARPGMPSARPGEPATVPAVPAVLLSGLGVALA